jgi:ribosomal protein L16/L10AE
MGGISGVSGAVSPQVAAVVSLVQEGTMSEEAHESKAEKAREAQRAAAKKMPAPAPSEKGEVGGGVNLMA